MNASTLQNFLDGWNWESAFSATTLARATRYFRSRLVTRLECQQRKDGYDLIGTVQGNAAAPYTTQVLITQRKQGLNLRTHCNCPVGTLCKHAAALLMVATTIQLEEWRGTEDFSAAHAIGTAQPQHRTSASPVLSDPNLREWKKWLNFFSTRTQDSPPPIADADRQFCLYLHVLPIHTSPLRISPAWLRPSKTKSKSKTAPASNQWVDPIPLTLGPHGPVPMPANGWPESVALALTVLLGSQPESISGRKWWAITNPQQEAALLELIQHYPLLDSKHASLHLHATRPLQLTWTAQEDGSQRLVAQVGEAPTARLLQGASLWYFLPEQHAFGRVDGSPSLLAALRYVPLLQPENASSVRDMLQHHGNDLPLPAERKTPEIIRCKPIPTLTLHAVSTFMPSPRIPAKLGLASLSFDYAGTRVAWSERQHIVRKISDGRIIDVHRDTEDENRILRILGKSGFEMLNNTFYTIDTHARQPHYSDWLLRPNPRRPALPPADWQPTLAKLQAQGFRFEYLPGFPHERVVEADAWHADLEPTGNAWFDVSLGVDVEGERIDMLPILRQLIANPMFPRHAERNEKKGALWRVKLDDTRILEVPLTRLRSLLEPLLEWLESEPNTNARIHRSQTALLDDTGLVWRGGEALRKQLEQLEARQEATLPHNFKATLRPYQRDGLAWLNALASTGMGGILADDMGLGKTVQMLAHILTEQQHGRLDTPALVIAPTSLVGNWQAEAARFTPTLNVLVLHGVDRAARYDDIATHDLVITTYPLLPRDRDKLLEAQFSLLILDEAQTVKNATSQAARVVREIPAKRRLAMTGTPLENHLGELWAQFDVVEPGLLGSQRQFAKHYRTPIEKHNDSTRQDHLNRRIRPLLLRRRKDDVLTDLPAKTEILRHLELEGAQRTLYESLRLSQHERVRQAVAERGLAQSGIVILDALLKLRQACCDPRLVKLGSAKKVTTSAKLDALLELLEGLFADGRRVLLFSQFTEMLALIEAALSKRKLPFQTLTGQTPAKQRTQLVNRFQQGAVPLFLISLKAGGTGLNLTAADTVIHYDPWWNPAVEAQATDRVHRIGQDKPVFVYRLICKDTVEEKIQALQQRKASLATAILEGGGSSTHLRFNADDLDALFGGM